MSKASSERVAPGASGWPSGAISLSGLGLVAAALLLAGCASNPRGANLKLALVIGNAAYENAAPLANPGNDAADICAALRKVGFKTLCYTNLRDRAEFEARVKEYTDQLGDNTVGVFYYSGHGVQAGEANFLIPTQVQPRTATEDPTRVLYAVNDLFDRLEKRPTRFQFVILDACRTDLFAQPPRQTARAAGAAAAPVGRSALIRSLQAVARASNGLQPIKRAPTGTMVLYATADKDTAFDGEGRNGPLTKHILQHIGTRGIFVEEFVKRVTRGVELETLKDYGRRQSPYIYGSFGGRFCFAGCPGDNDVPVTPSY